MGTVLAEQPDGLLDAVTVQEGVEVDSQAGVDGLGEGGAVGAQQFGYLVQGEGAVREEALIGHLGFEGHYEFDIGIIVIVGDGLRVKEVFAQGTVAPDKEHDEYRQRDCQHRNDD